MSKISRFPLGIYPGGRHWTRGSPAQSLNVVVTNGETITGALLFTLIQTLLFRRILLFPFGNSNAPPNDTVSVYLDYADPKKSPEGWHACAQFALVISNPHDPTIFTVSRKSCPPRSLCKQVTLFL